MEEANNRADMYAANSVLSIEAILNELEFIVRHASDQQTELSFLSCASINRQNTPDGQKIEIAFHATNTCSDKTNRSGKLLISYKATGDIFVSTDEYKIGEMQVSGNYVFQPGTFQQKAIWKLVVTDGLFTISTGDYYRFNVERITYFKQGDSTPDSSDDVFETLDAYYDLQLKSQQVVTLVQAESEIPYIQKHSCPDKFRPRSGKIRFERVTGSERFILLGNGNCEDSAKIAAP